MEENILKWMGEERCLNMDTPKNELLNTMFGHLCGLDVHRRLIVISDIMEEEASPLTPDGMISKHSWLIWARGHRLNIQLRG